jgi:flotillin
MLDFLNDKSLLFIVIAVLGGVVLIVSLLAMIAKFYRRCGADEALVRTGAGGNKVVIGGGILVYPILHQLQRVSLRSVKLSVERAGRMALVTADKIKANVSTELFIKVEPLAEDVLAAARSFGERNLDEHAIGDLIEGKLTDALRSVAANKTFMALHSERKEFAEAVQGALSEELKKNGLTLENVSITAFAMIPVTELDERDVFDADGLRAITESVQANREKTNQIQREKENAIQETNVRARMRQLELEQAKSFAEAEQQRRVQEYAAAQAAETAKAIFIQEQSRDMAAYEKSKAVETARIQQEASIAVAEADKQRREREALIQAEKGVQAAEIAKRREIEAASIEKDTVVQAKEIEREKTIEVARVAKVIAVVQSEEEQARASAAKALALAEEEKARQTIVTVEETARAERERQKKVIEAQAEADVRVALAKGDIAEAEAKALAAKKEAEAIETLAAADLAKKSAEAEATRKQFEARNAVSMKLIMRDLALETIKVMPQVAHELMEPARHISEIKVLQTQQPGSSNNNGAMGAASPILKTILEAGAAYPVMRELVGFAKDEKVAEKVKALLGEMGSEVSDALEPEPETNRPAPVAAE